MHRRILVPQAIELEALKSDTEQIQILEQLAVLFKRSKAIQILRQFSSPTIPDANKTVEQVAIAAAYSAGYSQALTDVQYFRPIFLEESPAHSVPRPLFGGPELARGRNDLLPGE